MDGKDTLALCAKDTANLAAYIPQHHTPIFNYTALDIVLMGRSAQIPALETPRQADYDAAYAAIDALNIKIPPNRKYTSLSGGERQMILIARAVCQGARMLIMDEPCANLDWANQHRLMEHIVSLAEKNYTVIMSTHNPQHPLSIGSKAVLLQNGQVAALGKPSDVITGQIMEQIYGVSMDVIKVKDRNGAERTICLVI